MNSGDHNIFTRLQGIGKVLRKIVPFTGGIAAAFIALFLYNIFFPSPDQLNPQVVRETISQVLSSATPEPATSSLVYQIIQPSLVLIETSGKRTRDDDGMGLGSGVVISDNGDILTSYHVVDNAQEIELIFADGTRTQGEVFNAIAEKDIAVVRPLQPPALIVPAVMGNPNAMSIGDEAYVVGNPFGLYGSMSAGVISGFERSFYVQGSEQKLEGLIQFDSAVNPGNSGGPLLNRYGQVVGIVVGILNPTEDNFFIGIGFAVPITIAGGAAGSPLY